MFNSVAIKKFMEPENLRRFMKKVLYLAILWGLAFLFYFLGWRVVLKTYVVFFSVVMILAILLQSGKGGGLAAIGGMGGENILGTRASTPVAKATFALGLLFIVGCMLLSKMPIRESGLFQPSTLPAVKPVAGEDTGNLEPASAKEGAAEAQPKPATPKKTGGETPKAPAPDAKKG